MELRSYTLEEANAELPDVRRLAGAIAGLVALIPELQEELRTAEYERGRPGAGPAEGVRHRRARSELESAELELAAALAGLEARGVMLKDPGQGLVDFPSYRDGELVELCWKLGEESVGHWHPVGEGFAGRKPV